MAELHWRLIEDYYQVKRSNLADAWDTLCVELEEYNVVHGHCDVNKRSWKLGV